MSANTGKRVAWGIIAAIIVTLGVFWFMPRRPKKTSKPLVVVGVGLFLARNQETHKFEVKRIYPNSPAEKAGLVPGLVLNKVNDSLAETNNIKGVSALLMGLEGTKVTLEMIDANGNTNEVEVARAQFVNHSTQ